MDGEDAHRDLVYAWDPDHAELSRAGLVKGCVVEPERADGRGLVDNPLKRHGPRYVEGGAILFQGSGSAEPVLGATKFLFFACPGRIPLPPSPNDFHEVSFTLLREVGRFVHV